MTLPRERFRLRLASGPLLADGGMGTLMYSRGVPQSACLDELAVGRPDLVGAVHREYLEAGADLIETLSLGANRHRLAVYGLENEVGRLNRRAAQVAREAREVSGREALVGGSIGPLAAPMRQTTGPLKNRARAFFREQVEGLLEGGVDVLVLETFSDLEGLLIALGEARRAADIPVIASLTFGEELVLLDGTSPEGAAAALAAAGADVIGVNCGAGPSASINALARMGPPPADGPFRSIMPNAGLPQRLEGRFLYAAGAEYFASVTPRMLAAGARIVGGCCGTTPAHVAAMRAALATVAPAALPGSPAKEGSGDGRATAAPLPEAVAPGRRATLAERSGPERSKGPRPRPVWRASWLPAGSWCPSRSIRRGASGSSGRSRPPGSSGTRAWMP